MSDGIAGSIIMDAASLFFMGGLLIYTSLYRKRGRLDDRLFFAMIAVNIALAVADGTAYLLERRIVEFAGSAISVCNIVFYAAFSIFPYLYMLYLDYRVYKDTKRIRKRKLVGGIPCFLLLILLLANLKTGWLYYVGEGNIYYFGPYNNLVFLPVAIYFLVSLYLVYRINPRLILLALLLLASRIAFGRWFRSISSTAFIYTLFLVCTHIYVMNRPLNEEAPLT